MKLSTLKCPGCNRRDMIEEIDRAPDVQFSLCLQCLTIVEEHKHEARRVVRERRANKLTEVTI
jgi:hypothetical protein